MIYDRAIATATRLIAKYGAAGVWTVPAAQDGAVDPWRDVREGDPTDYDVSIALFSAKDLGYGSTIALAAMTGTEVPVNQGMGLMAGNQPFVVDLTGIVMIDGSPLDIFKIDVLKPNNIPLLYYLWLN